MNVEHPRMQLWPGIGDNDDDDDDNVDDDDNHFFALYVLNKLPNIAKRRTDRSKD